MTRVLVTGATGFLGGAIARELARQGVAVRGIGRNLRVGADLESCGVSFQSCDLARERGRLRELVKECDAVVHAAALSAPWGPRAKFVAANVDVTRHVLEACASAKVGRLVHISSPSVLFALQHQHKLTESTPWSSRAGNHYIATKREAELRAIAAGAVVLRPRALFGPGDTTLLPRIIRVARRGVFPLVGAEDPLMDLTWIGDAVEAVGLALAAPDCCRGRTYHISSDDPLPRSEVLGTLLSACGLNVRYRHVPIGQALAVAGALEWTSHVLTLGRWEPPLTRYSAGVLAFTQTLDVTAAREELGYAPQTDVRAALEECGRAWRIAEGAA